MTAQNNMNLHWMVQINEEIKKVIDLSHGVNLVAINAMLVSKQAGERSRGFGVVSLELRGFSGRLRIAAGVIGDRIFHLIGDSAAMLKNRNELIKLRRAQEEGGKDFMLSALNRKEVSLQHLALAMEQDNEELLRQVRRTLQLCGVGTALARCARIEAVYGGSMAATLKQVALEIEVVIDKILEILKALEASLAAREIS